MARSLFSSSGERLECLREIKTLCNLPGAVLAGFALSCRRLLYRKGAVVFLSGAPAFLYIVADGRVALLTRPTAEVEVQISTHGPSQLVGEESLFLGEQAVDAVAATDSVLLRIPPDAVLSALDESTAARRALEVELARRLSFLEGRIGEIAVHSVKQRLLLLFKRLPSRPCAAGSGLVLAEGLTHEELARLVGASRVAVSNALRQLAQEGLIIIEGHRIVVQNPTGSTDPAEDESVLLRPIFRLRQGGL